MNCTKCGMQGKDLLVDGQKIKKVLGMTVGDSQDGKPYCRDHLIEAFKNGFLNFDKRMVVFYPGLEDISKGEYLYPYDSVKGFLGEDAGKPTYVTKAFDSIQGACQKCGNPAQVAYFGKETITWEKEYGFPTPMYQKITANPQILCRVCTFEQIKDSLRNFKLPYEDGLFLPTWKDIGEGIYFTAVV